MRAKSGSNAIYSIKLIEDEENKKDTGFTIQPEKRDPNLDSVAFIHLDPQMEYELQVLSGM